jgi:U3 small nucleolar RNA-associated protein 4
VARENNSIEIWKADTFAQIVVVPGHKNVDIRCLHWLEPDAVPGNAENILYYNRQKGKKTLTKKRRLITTGLNGVIIEWDLLTMQPKSKLNIHCAIWQSVMVGKFMYVACEDGSIRVLKVKKNKIELVRMMVKNTASCLSLSIDDSTQLKMEDGDTGPVAFLWAGYADGTIKQWDVKNNTCLIHIDKQTEKMRKKEGPCLIWKLCQLQGFLISGDSSGELVIWNMKFGTLVQSFKQLKADILCLAVNPEHSTIYASGVDSRVISATLKQDGDDQSWVLSSIFRG